MHSDRFSDLFTYFEHWVQRRHRFLKNHRNIFAPNAIHFDLVGLREIFTIK